MGRYYSGDIEGKFWFAVQDSSAADRFGSMGVQPNYLEYDFDESQLPQVREELKAIEQDLGEDLAKLEKFFDENNGYNDEMLVKATGIDAGKIRHVLSEYADYILGKKIEKCLVETGYCHFEAEC